MLPDDLYPVTVDRPGPTLRKARVFSRDGRVRVYVDSNRHGVVLAAEGDLLSATKGRNRSYTVEVSTDSGEETWTISRASGCGCGSRLKTFTLEAAWA